MLLVAVWPVNRASVSRGLRYQRHERAALAFCSREHRSLAAARQTRYNQRWALFADVAADCDLVTRLNERGDAARFAPREDISDDHTFY